jgi:GAF domain-containing protein
MSSGTAFGTGPYDVILDIATAMVKGGSVEATLQTIVENVGKAMFAESASLGSYDAERDEFVHEAEWQDGGLTPEREAEIGVLVQLSEMPGLRRQLQDRAPVEYRIDDPGLNENYREYMTRRGVKTILDCALTYANNTIGLLGIEESRFVRRCTPSEIALFSQLCNLAAIGIHTARQARRLEETERRLQQALGGAAAPSMGGG